MPTIPGFGATYMTCIMYFTSLDRYVHEYKRGKSAMTAETERVGVGGLISALKWI